MSPASQSASNTTSITEPHLISDVITHWGLQDEYPFAGEYHTVPGGRMHYVESGTGAPVLFVHGNPTWSFAWRHFVRHFSQCHRAIAVDHLGCGLSDKPLDAPYRLQQHCDNLQSLIETLDLRNITLVVHDWGGAIGLGTAVRMPERFSRFVVCNTAAFRSSRIPWRIAVCRWPVVGPLGVRGLNLFARAALWMATEKRSHWTKAMRRGYLAPYDTWNHRIAIQRFVEDIPLSPRHPSYGTLVEIENRLPLLKSQPMLLAWGERDWCFTPAFRAEFEQRFPAAEVIRFADAGHYVFEDARDRLIERMDQFFQAHPIV